MAEGRRVQLRKTAARLTAVWVVLLFAVSMFSPLAVFTGPPGADTDAEMIGASAVWPVLWWCFSWPILFSRREPSRGLGRLTRLWRTLWTLGCLLLLLHVAVAFHLGHAWSHAAAWEHTRRVGGYGNGIYANYAFVLIWIADVTWSWASFRSYLSRPNWLRWGIFLFQAFIVFNAAVVFAPTWNTRTLFLIMFLASSVCLWVVWLAGHRPSPQ